MDMTFLLKCLIVYCITIIFVDHLTTGQQDSCSDCTRFEMRKDLSCHVVLTFLRTTDVTTCMRDCTDDCHGLLFNELERNCILCASVKIATGNPDKKATAFEKVKKKCGDQTPSDSTKTSQKLCPPFENKKNGKVVGESLLEGATKNLTCHPGYSPRDRNNVVSQCKNSQWTKITDCAIVCPTFENINNGKVEGDTLFEGATRNLTCNPGYSPRDSNAVLSLCQNGQWTKITECIKDCPPFENNSKGNVTGDSLFEGATRNLTCDTGYSPRDDNIVVSRCQNGHWTNITECVKVQNCVTLQNNANGKLKSGLYQINRGGRNFHIYCNYGDGDGYVYISTSIPSDVDLNLASLSDDRSHVKVIHRRQNGRQYEAAIRQIDAFKTLPVSVQFNKHDGYNGVINTAMGPYVFTGFVPLSLNFKYGTQGWKVNGNEFKFTNCDGNPNSYFALLLNANKAGYTPNNGGKSSLMYAWYELATPVSELLPEAIFSPDYEIQHGGCGGYSIGKTETDVTGVTIGQRFIITCSEPDDVRDATKTFGGVEPGSVVTYLCNPGYTSSGDLMRTCTPTGGWSGVQPTCTR
ncbi:uncharacterized protein LOC127855856 [Dreissena polymorpha]|nr:uncharacterized protein LOC127855856 [Dreissena polymorpha]